MTAATSINAPQQKRSLVSQNKIIDATSDLLAEKAFDEITVTDICAKAQLSTGAFYARFSSKTAVLYAIQMRYLTRLEQDARELAEAAVAAGNDAKILLSKIFLVIVRPALAARGVMHAVTAESTRDIQVMANITRFAATLSDVLFLALTKIAERDDQMIVRRDVVFATRACLAMMQQEWLYPERPSEVDIRDDEALAASLARLFAGYVGPPAPSR